MNVDFDFETLYKNERKSLKEIFDTISQHIKTCLLYTSPSPRDS